MRRVPIQDVFQATEARLKRLILQGIDGNEAAYEEFLRLTAPYLRAYLRRRMSRWPDAVEDLVQEALLAIHNQRHTYDAHAPLTSWIYAITRYKLIDWLRRHARHDSLTDPFDEEHELFSSAALDAAEAGRDLDKVLTLLPEQQCAAIRRTKLEGWSVRETANEMQISESSVKVAVHRGLKALAQKLRQTYGH